MIAKPLEVKAESKYSLWLRFNDGTKGVVDLSHLAHKGIFNQWEKEDLFLHPYIDKETSAIAWNSELELSPDALYLKLKGKTFEVWKQSTSHVPAK